MTGIKKFDIVSEKYGVCGILYAVDDPSYVKLEFEYQGKIVKIELQDSETDNEDYKEMVLPDSKMNDDDLKEQVLNLMEKYIERHFVQPGRKTMMHYWKINEVDNGEQKYLCLHGLVSGHPRIPDSYYTDSSEVVSIVVDWDAEECIVQTQNTVYHCPLAYCEFSSQDDYPQFVPDYDKVRKKFYNSIESPSIEPGNVLLVMASWERYYFHSLYYVPEGKNDKVPIVAAPHIGTFQDSFLIKNYSTDEIIDIRYFPHHGNVEFYMEDTDNCPWYIENIGDMALYFRTIKGVIKVNPGERKKVCRENAEKKYPHLSGGDLYPAVFL